ncbi:MAG: tetratricopeptide repeat protein [Acidobacteriia bacterium]|nr:tetratricopeptide repeat protein [Terriglobia bacterium]
MTICLALLLLLAPPQEQPDAIERGFDHFYNLEFEEALQVFTNLAQSQPDRADLRNHLAQAFLFREMLKAGALESEMVTGGNSFLRRPKMNPSALDQQHFDQAIAAAMRLSQKRLDGNPDDPQGLYNLGVAHGLRANYNYLVRKAWVDSLRDATAGRKLHNRLTALEPSLIDAKLMQGMHDYVIGSLPWYYKALGFLAGFRGDREQGIRTLQEVAAKGDKNRADAAILLAAIYRRERRPADAVPLLNGLTGKFPRNYLLHLELAQMYSDLGDRPKALEALVKVERMKHEGLPGFRNMPIEKVYYFRGNLQFWFDEWESAVTNLSKATAKAEDLDPNTGVMAWMRLGQSLDLLGRRQQAMEAYRQASKYASGSAVARESEGYLRSPYRRVRKP